MDYIIRTDNFEGPFELLLELIKKREMKIHDLHISQITNDFIANLKEMQSQNIEISSDFMVMASMLLEIKSRMLLPLEKEKGDPREELVQQLMDYQEYKGSIEKLHVLKQMEQMLFKRQRIEKIKIKKMGNIKDIIKSYQSIMEQKFNQKHTPLDDLTIALANFKYTLEDRMESLKSELAHNRINVGLFFEGMREKEEIVVTFGALLELVKIQFIDIQIENDNQIYIVKREEEVNG